jgi:hypothetical protein
VIDLANSWQLKVDSVDNLEPDFLFVNEWHVCFSPSFCQYSQTMPTVISGILFDRVVDNGVETVTVEENGVVKNRQVLRGPELL